MRGQKCEVSSVVGVLLGGPDGADLGSVGGC